MKKVVTKKSGVKHKKSGVKTEKSGDKKSGVKKSGVKTEKKASKVKKFEKYLKSIQYIIMYYTPLANYSVSENNPFHAQARAPLMAGMTAISPTTGELMVPGNAGVVIQANSGNNAIRVSGTATTTSGLVSNGTTANQIQFFTNGDINAAFDQLGLYLIDNDWINIGSGKLVIYTGAGNYTGNLVIGTATSGSKLTSAALYNTFIGRLSGVENTSGTMNTHVGYGAGQFISTGGSNTCVGFNAGQNQSTGNNNTYIGQNAGLKDTGVSSVYIGSGAGGGSSTITGSFNQCIGVLTGVALTSGYNNTFIGKDAGRTCTTGNSNIIIGNYSDVSSVSVVNEIIIGGGKTGKGSNTTYISGNNVFTDGPINGSTILSNAANGNLSVGANAFSYNGAGSYGTSIGVSAGNASMTGGSNTCIGYAAGNNLTNGYGNVLLGNATGRDLTSGAANTFLGGSTGLLATTGVSNVAVGNGACMTYSGAGTGSYNSCLGENAGNRITSGYSNTLIGRYSGVLITTGYDNVLIGKDSGLSLTNGYSNVYIGAGVASSSSGAAGEIVIGAGAVGKGTNTCQIGNIYLGSITFGNSSSPNWTTTCDQRIKKNITPLMSGISIIMKLKPCEFDYIITNNHEIGFIAQEYQSVLPDQIRFIQPSEEQKELVGDDDIKCIQQNLSPYFVKAIQEQQDEINYLKEQLSEISVLKAQVYELNELKSQFALLKSKIDSLS